ncbi:MAG: putative sulfate exporter family transporter [Spirochaetales bacterium]|nr:putative sulfate exporter family transporter [Spirochaetales bacterium]
MKLIPGIIICLLTAGAALLISPLLPLDGVTLAILLGIVLGHLRILPPSFSRGIRFSSGTILSWAIALMGFRLDYSVLLELGLPTLFMILAGVCLSVGAVLLFGRLGGLDRDQKLLVGIGNGVCGSSAIGAAQSVIGADRDKVGIALGVINLLGTAGIFLLPLWLSLFPGFSAAQKSVVIGNTLQAVGQVSAAGFTLGDGIGERALLVKMGRILLITPVVLILRRVYSRGNKGEGTKLPAIPRYILFFLIFSLVSTLSLLPETVTGAIKGGSEFLLMTAMAGMGMGIELGKLTGRALPVLAAGATGWILQIVVSTLLAGYLL